MTALIARPRICIPIVLLMGAFTQIAFAKCGNIATRAPVNPEETQQVSSGELCRDTKTMKQRRVNACDMLAEAMSSDMAEFRMAADQFLLLLENDPQFFFQFFEKHQKAFETWMRVVRTSSFVAPYLYSDTTKMEARRLCLIDLVRGWTSLNSREALMKHQVVHKLETIRVRVVD